MDDPYAPLPDGDSFEPIGQAAASVLLAMALATMRFVDERTNKGPTPSRESA